MGIAAEHSPYRCWNDCYLSPIVCAPAETMRLQTGRELVMTDTSLQKLAFFLLLALIVYVAGSGVA